MQPILPVYLIHWNRPDWCAAAVESLAGSEGLSVEITVVDNGQTTGPPLGDLLPDNVRILPMTANLGYAGGANRALSDCRQRHPDAGYCVVGSHDLHVEPRTLATLLSWALKEPDYGVLAPALVAPFESSGGLWDGRVARQVPLVRHPGITERHWASGTCLLLRLDCMDAIGGFDAALGSYVEDVDVCLRARDAGWRVGVVTQASARGLGVASEDAGALTVANTVILVAKRQGSLATARLLGSLAVWTVRSAAGTLSWWRSAARREESRRFLLRHLRSWRLVGRGAWTRWRRS